MAQFRQISNKYLRWSISLILLLGLVSYQVGSISQTSTATVSVVSGWNLLGNGTTAAIDPTSVAPLGSSNIFSLWKWDPTGQNWEFFTPTQNDGGASYAASKGYTYLSTINPGEGFWVNANQAFSLQIPSATSYSSTNFQLGRSTALNSGWNLISVGDSISPCSLNLEMSATPPAAGQVPINFSSLWAWDPVNTTWFFYAPLLDAAGTNASYASQHSYLDFSTNSKLLGFGTGFWVNMPTATSSVSGSVNCTTSTTLASNTSTSTSSTTTSSGKNTTTTTTVSSTTTTTGGGNSPQITITPSSTSLSGTLSLSGTVTLSLNSSTPYSSVSWYLDTTPIGTGTGVGNPITWNTTTATNGQHAVIAVINLGGGSSLQVNQAVNINNDNLVVTASATGNSGIISINAQATSNSIISSVSISLDGTSLSTLTAPNYCSQYCSGVNNMYQFKLGALTSGSHTVIVTAKDSSGAIQSITLSVPVSNPPIITITKPIDGGIINGAGTLNLSGTMSTDKSGGLTVTAYLGQLPIPITQGSASFSGALNLSGIAPGTQTLSVSAKDSSGISTTVQNTIIIGASSNTTYSAIFTMGAGSTMLATDGPNLLYYQAADGSYRIRNIAAGSEVSLAGTNTFSEIYHWKLNNGYAYAEAFSTDCKTYETCVYQWSPSGSKTNLSNSSPNSPSAGGAEYPISHGNYVIWANDGNSYTLYNVSNQTYTLISSPPGANYLGNTSVDFSVSNTGVVNFFYWENTGTNFYDIYQWNSISGTSTKLTNGTQENIYPQTDGIRAAWYQMPSSASTGTPTNLVTIPVNGGVTTTISTSANNFLLNNGVLAWTEASTSTNNGNTATSLTALKVNTASGTTTLSTASNFYLLANGGGYVLYQQGSPSTTYIWNSTNNLSSDFLDTSPGNLLINGKYVYFTLGQSGAVYQVVLP